jgi:hypothetical protein
MQASGDEFAATGAGDLGIRQDVYSVNSVWPYTYQDTQGAIAADLGLGKDSSASADYVLAETNGDRTYALGVNLKAKGETSAYAIAGAGDGIALVNGVLEIDQGSATGLNALENGAVSAGFMFAGTDTDSTESFGVGMQANGDESALAYTAVGDKLTVWADSVKVKDGTLTGLGAKGAMSHVQADMLHSEKAGTLSTSHGIGLLAQGEGAIAVGASGDKISFSPDEANVKKGSLTGAAANGDASVTSAGLASFKDFASTLSIGDLLEAVGEKSAALATGKGEKVTIQSNEDKARVFVEQGSITGVTAYKNARVAGDLLTSGDIQLDIGSLVLDGEGSLGTGLSGSGEKSAAIASGTGDRVVIVADEEKGRAKVEKGSLAGVTTFKNAQVAGGLMASGQMQVGIGTQMLDGMGSAGMGLSGSGDKSASLATGSGDSVLTEADKNKGMSNVEKGAITAVTAYKNAKVASDLLASGDVQLAIGPLVLDGKGSLGTGLSASGDDSASCASGFGDEVFTKANNQMGEAKVTNGGIVGMAAHESAQVGADLMGSSGLTDGTVAGWIGLNPSATGTLSALGTGFGSEVNVQADAAVVETTTGSIIGLTASGQDSITSADSIGGYQLLGMPTLSASKVLAKGEKSASLASGASLTMLKVESDGTQGSVDAILGSVVGSSASGGARITADALDFKSGAPSATVLIAEGTKGTIASASGASITLQPDGISVLLGSLVGASAANANGGAIVSSTSLSAGVASASGTILRAENADNAIIAAVSGATADLSPTRAGMTAGALIGVGAISLGPSGDLHADSLSTEYGTTSRSSSGGGLFSKAGTSALLGASGALIFDPSKSYGIESGVLPYADAGARTTALGNSVSSSNLQSAYEVTGLITANRNAGGSITASGSSETRMVFAGYFGSTTKTWKNTPGTYTVNAWYNGVLDKGASIT